MICIKLFGGLGNQMFQYAIGRAISHRFNTDLLVDSSFFLDTNKNYNATKRSFDLSIFNLPIREVSKTELKILKPIQYRIFNTLFLKLGIGTIQSPSYFIEREIGFNKSVLRIKDNSYLSGYWQSYLYFQDIPDILRNDFSFPDIHDINLKSLVSKIDKENSVSIHIRRGDFISNSPKNIHASCSTDYYNAAIHYIYTKFADAYFFVFSDDVEWVKSNLALPLNCIYVTGNVGENSFIDMQLMSLCKHNIIANSSFSWWAAWLNNNTSKIVISPLKWYNNEYMNKQTMDLIPKEWIRI